MTRAAYFECFAGASGDMILGALLHAGWPEAAFRAVLESVPLGGWQVEVGRVKKGAVHATQVRFHVTEPQPERDLSDIVPIIEGSGLEAAAKERALRLFRELADVEGLEHGLPPETVHFHEVGAVDSILDIVGACAGLHALGVERLFVSPINVGGGTVPTRDGILPVPGPAALELLRRKGAPIYASEYGPEFLTPTGALVLATLADGFGPFPPMRVERIGYGAGQKDFRIPNVLRVSIGELHAGPANVRRPSFSFAAADGGAAVHHPAHDHGEGPGYRPHDSNGPAAAGGGQEDVVVQLETNVDDMNPEWYGHLSERLFEAGALDVTLAPVIMKKGRPGTLISVLARPELAETALSVLFAETTTLGVRLQELSRRTLERQVATVETPYGPIRVKLALLSGVVRSAAPEYDDCRMAAARTDAPLQAVYDAARRAVGTVTPGPGGQPVGGAAALAE